MTHSVLDIADEILRIAKERGVSITPMKLMKLTYIAHGWYLANRDAPLFLEEVEAWRYGPVIPELYQVTKKYGRNPIPADLIEDTSTATDGDTRSFLESVFDKYGDKGAIFLSNLTHQTGTPWDKTYQPGWTSAVIPTDVIRSHYKHELYDR